MRMLRCLHACHKARIDYEFTVTRGICVNVHMFFRMWMYTRTVVDFYMYMSKSYTCVYMWHVSMPFTRCALTTGSMLCVVYVYISICSFCECTYTQRKYGYLGVCVCGFVCVFVCMYKYKYTCMCVGVLIYVNYIYTYPNDIFMYLYTHIM